MAVSLKKLRAKFTKKIKALRRVHRIRVPGSVWRVTSYIRTDAGNERVGGAPESRHLVGLAADVQIFEPGSEGMAQLLGSLEFDELVRAVGLRLLNYPNHMHLDLALKNEEEQWLAEYFYYKKNLALQNPGLVAAPFRTETDPLLPHGPAVFRPVSGEFPRDISDTWGLLPGKPVRAVRPGKGGRHAAGLGVWRV